MSDAGFPFKIEEILILRLAVSGKGQKEIVQCFLRCLILEYRIDLSAVTGGKHDGFLDPFLFIQMNQPASRTVWRNRKLLTNIYRDCLMIQPQNDQLHDVHTPLLRLIFPASPDA